MSQGKCVFTDACTYILRLCVFSVQATEQFSGVFSRNHLGSKKNTSVIIVITFCNYPYATLLEQRKTTVSLLPRSPPKHARPFHGAAGFKGGVTLLQLCQHSDETRKHSVDGKALVFKASKARSTHILFLCHCQTGRDREKEKKIVCSVNLRKRAF